MQWHIHDVHTHIDGNRPTRLIVLIFTFGPSLLALKGKLVALFS